MVHYQGKKEYIPCMFLVGNGAQISNLAHSMASMTLKRPEHRFNAALFLFLILL